MLELGNKTRKNDKQFSYSLKSASNQPTRWLVLCWSTFGVRTSHGWLWTHKTHHGPNSRETTTFPHIIYSAPLREGYIQMTFCPGTPLPRSELPQLCGAITLCSDLRLRQGLKKVVALVESFPTVCCTPPTHTKIELILNISWSEVKLPVWLPTFLFAITCVIDVQMIHESPF
jgi:hypothetical protein